MIFLLFQYFGDISADRYGKSTIWRCISYWKWWFSISMLVLPEGRWHNFFPREICRRSCRPWRQSFARGSEWLVDAFGVDVTWRETSIRRAETGGGSDGRSETVDGRQNRHPKWLQGIYGTQLCRDYFIYSHHEIPHFEIFFHVEARNHSIEREKSFEASTFTFRFQQLIFKGFSV